MGEVKEVLAYYNSKSESYDDAFDALYFKVYDAITWKYIEPYIPIEPDALVLDAGGGTGRWAIKIARKGCKVVLMDISKGMLKVATDKVKKEQLQKQVLIKTGNIAKTGFENETFDMILCEHALFLFRNPDDVIKEFYRILKRKARLIISVQNRYVQSLELLY